MSTSKAVVMEPMELKDMSQKPVIRNEPATKAEKSRLLTDMELNSKDQPNGTEVAAQAETPASKSHMKEFVAAFIVCLGPIAMGQVSGYTSTALPQMKEKFKFDDTANSLIGSLMTLGALTGALVSGVGADVFGRKSLIMYNCVPFVFGWFLLAAAQNVYMLFVGRFVTGFCVGITSMCSPTYVTEIASPEVRGVLGSCFQLFVNIGILFVFVIGTYVNWNYLAMICEFIPAIQVLLMIPLPESPSWLVRQGRRLEAIDALIWLRGPTSDTNAECNSIQENQAKETKMSIRELKKPVLFRPFLIMVGEMIVQQASGINAVIFNAVDIFKNASSSIEGTTAGMIVGACMVAATIAAFFLIERAGRRILLLISAIMMAVGLGLFDVYYCIRANNPTAAATIWWLPVICLVDFVFFMMLGFGPVPWLMMGEMFPSQARGLASSLLVALNWTIAFIVTLTFQSLQNAFGPFGTYWLFAGICTAGAVFVFFFVPETKGKTLEEVQEYFVSKPKPPTSEL